MGRAFVVYFILSNAVMALSRFLHSGVLGSALANLQRKTVSTSLRKILSRLALDAMSFPNDGAMRSPLRTHPQLT